MQSNGRAHPDDWLPCHAGPHWMEPLPVPAGTPRPGGVVVAWWRCVRCTTERHDQLDPTTLQVVTRKYDWPDGYRAAAGEAHSRGEWKATYLQAVGLLSKRQSAAARRYHKELWESRGDDQ